MAYNYNPHFALEMSLGGSSNDHTVRLMDSSINPPYEPEEVSTEETTDLLFFHGNGVIHLLKGRFVPFITAGVGWTAFIDELSFTVNYGGGLKFFITDKVALRLDIREFRTNLKGTIEQVHTPGWDPSKWGTEEVRFTDDLRFEEITVGISYLF